MIDYSIIHNALDFYEQEELYTRVEVPWIVSKGISDLTRPTNVHGHDVVKNGRTKTFIGSGEQGFLYLWAKNQLADGEYVTCTPCMRDDDFDETHLKYFMKVELIKFGKYVDPKTDVDRIIRDARKFFEKYVNPSTLEEVETSEGRDILFNGIEIGSYGIRECILGKWIYGTGVAEPRFSRLIKRFGTT